MSNTKIDNSQSVELFEELSDQELSAIVGGFSLVNVNASSNNLAVPVDVSISADANGNPLGGLVFD